MSAIKQTYCRERQRINKILILSCLLILTVAGCAPKDWRTASRESAGIAPDPTMTREAVIQVYAARTWGWRGWFAVHTWVATKPSHADSYTVYEVVGWRQRRGLPVVRIEQDLPDRHWYGERPRLIKEFRSNDTDRLIAAIDKAARNYPWSETYKAFPGPNSNTFVAWIARQVPELDLELPLAAIGSGYAH